MQRPLPSTFARFVALAENRSALMAVEHAASCISSRHPERVPNPLYLHGPTGTGKTYLVSALVEEVTRRCPDRVVTVLSGDDLETLVRFAGPSQAEDIEAALSCDLLIVEDLQHLSPRIVSTLVRVFDERHGRQSPMVFTAPVGPPGLDLPARVTSRLACGLVVALEPLPASSRLTLLQDKAQRRQLAIGRDVLAWLADHLTGGGRQLEGALAILETLTRMHGRSPDLAMVADHFREQAEAGQPTVERIVQKVGRHFHVAPRQIQSEQRGRKVLLPRQVGMYLARQLTTLSLQQIGTYFGGRDHSTVLHACRKVEQALACDPVLSGTVRQLHSELA